jgi:hypothetical protein
MDDSVSSLAYDLGINEDVFQVWRDSGHIGFIHICFRILVEAMYDLICGDPDAILSASVFFYGQPVEPDTDREPYDVEPDHSTGSFYNFYARVLGNYSGVLPPLVVKYRNQQVSQREIEALRNLYTVMATI